jgi:hypothetical protein
MQTYLFRSYDLILESDETDLIRDVSLDLEKAQKKLRQIQERQQQVEEQPAAEIHLLTMAAIKLSAAIVAALLSTAQEGEV